MDVKFGELLLKAKSGNKDALTSVINSVQDRIYRLALKMLYHVSDAEDATQEILIRIITKLDSFREESSFSTWAMTIAANHLKNRLKNEKERWYNFKRCEKVILGEIPDVGSASFSSAEQDIIVEEMRISCMHALHQCLDRDHRLAYILGVSIGVKGSEGAKILEIKPSAYRKRLSRAREKMREFLKKNCDFFDVNNRCNCRKQSLFAAGKGMINPENTHYAMKRLSSERVKEVESALADLNEAAREAALMKINQDFKAPDDFIEGIKKIIENRYSF